MRSKDKDFKQVVQDFRDLSPARRSAVSVLIAIGLAVIAAAERDIQRRPTAQVRGSKLIWRLVCLNALGAAVYFRWGRRES